MGTSSKTKIRSVRLPNDTAATLDAEAQLRGAKPADLIKIAVEEWCQRQVLGKGRAV